MQKTKIRIALAIGIAVGVLPLPLWRTGGCIDLFMIAYGFAGMAVFNYCFSRTWRQTALLALPLLLYPAFSYASGMMYYHRISDDGMTKVMTELFTYLSAIVIFVTQTAAVVVKAIVERKKRKEAELSAQKEIPAGAGHNEIGGI